MHKFHFRDASQLPVNVVCTGFLAYSNNLPVSTEETFAYQAHVGMHNGVYVEGTWYTCL